MNVKLLAYTPNPDELCSIAARTCYSADVPSEIEPNLNLLRKVIQSGHTSVLEHASFTFAIEGISRACSHQLVRHRMASYSQQSQRYVKMDGFEYVIPKSIEESKRIINFRWEQDVFENAYMPDDTPVEAVEFIMDSIGFAYCDFNYVGIPEEDARYILPNACCTNLVMTMNARSLLNFFAHRCCVRAQWEIRELANEMLKLVKEVAPVIFENAGASCVQNGYCPEGKKGCGKVPTIEELTEFYEYGKTKGLRE